MTTAIMIFLGLVCAGVIACTIHDILTFPRRRTDMDYHRRLLRELMEEAARQEAEKNRTERVA